MSNQMPQMPTMGESVLPSEPEKNEEEVTLPGEQENEDRPSYITPESENSSVVKVAVPKKGIEVTATRKGFYNQQRLKQGDKFVVKKFENLGEWMVCDDDILEKKRVEFFKNKKAKAKAKK